MFTNIEKYGMMKCNMAGALPSSQRRVAFSQKMTGGVVYSLSHCVTAPSKREPENIFWRNRNENQNLKSVYGDMYGGKLN